MIIRDPDDRDRRLFLQAKNNLADAPGMAFRIEDGRVVWDPEPVLNDADFIPQQARELPRDVAAKFLERELCSGPVLAEVVKARADVERISQTTLQRAKSAVGVESKKRADAWYWSLRGPVNGDSPPQDPSSSNVVQ